MVIQFVWIVPIEGSGCQFFQFVFKLPIFPLEVNNDRIQELNLW